MNPTESQSKHFTTADGVRLHYLEGGSGKPLVLIHGWSQCAEEFKHQIAELSSGYRVIAVDQRGHGESEKPGFGYKIHRLSEDLREMLISLDLTDVNVLGHSMGCSVIWGYWDLFGSDRLARIILVDEPPHLTSNPAWTPAETEAAGPIFSPESAYDTCNALVGSDGEETTRALIGGMLTKNCPEDVKEWIFQCNFRMTRRDASALLFNHAFQDWRDVIPRITLPTLAIGGRVSPIPWKSQDWIAQQIKGAQLEIFEEEEGGSHFMFIENPDKFNRIVKEFIG
ncbi:MAG: alpha/beta hydrolase [Deltaproteobacteria bacterium]|jgi:pimeloyl-ACP methyl ester carboxylesterase|nr:alpha/beta hydrolase [Deltaproteobacteria bacterium]